MHICPSSLADFDNGHLRTDQNFFPVICLSVSRYTSGGSAERHGFNYVPGSGDDHEAWAPEGFSSALFWENKDRLLSASRLDLPALMHGVQLKWSSHAANSANSVICIGKTLISMAYDMALMHGEDALHIRISKCDLSAEDASNARALHLSLPTGTKDHLIYFTANIDHVVNATLASLRNGKRVVLHIDPETGKSGEDVAVGIALATLCEFISRNL